MSLTAENWMSPPRPSKASLVCAVYIEACASRTCEATALLNLTVTMLMFMALHSKSLPS